VRFEERRVVDQALAAEEPCLGAVFCSYAFDPAYFEEHVLRSVLRLQGDPDEDPARFHEEARRALQEVPVACIVDASVRKPGRRLPYDVHLVRRRTFHPKVILVLFESEARLAIGSGNVTKSGLEQNTEMFFVRRLPYTDIAAAALLLDVDEFLGECAALAETPGTQLDLVRRTLTNRLGTAPRSAPEQRTDVQFVSSFGGRLLDQLNRAIHESAKITRVGVLAPFFEQDDLDAGDAEGGLDSVLAELLAMRPSPGAVFDVGVPWENESVAAPTAEEPPSLDDGFGSLWAWRKRETLDGVAVERMDYLVIDATAAKRIQATSAAGETCRLDRDTLEEEIAERRLWRVKKPVVHAPKVILRRLAQERPVHLWLHPTSGISPAGRVRQRPLHAKVMLVTTVYRGRTSTYALIGSANASRSALARGVAQAGNVEAGVLCRFEGEVLLHDVLPSLVSYSLDGVDLVEREAPLSNVDLSAWIDEVVHDAALRTVRITWHAVGPAPLGAWTLRYVDRELARGDGTPATDTVIETFDLDAASAEVSFLSGGGEWQLPIRVLDLAALPTNPLLASLGLRELLALLGRRVGAERLATLRAQRGAAGITSVLDAVFGEGFGPTDVFRAWWGAAEDLKLAATVAAFRRRLIGPTGVRTAWQHLEAVPDEVLSRDEVWVYGCELLRELQRVELSAGPDTKTKEALLADVVTELGGDLARLAPSVRSHAWMTVVSRFYGIEVRDGGA